MCYRTVWIPIAVLVLAGCRKDQQSSDQPHTPQAVPTARPAPTETEESRQFSKVSSAFAGAFQGVVKPGSPTSGPFFVEGRLAYPALTCVNPDCPAKGKGDGGAPFLFVREFKDVRQGSDGAILWPANPEVTPVPLCPACKQNGWIRPYVLPGAEQRLRELRQELMQSRQSHRIAKSQGLARAPDHRTPSEVMKEMESLRQLYLVPEQR